MDGMTESEPTLSSTCCTGPGPYRPIGQCRVIGRIWNRKFNVSIKAGHGPSHSTDFNWPRLLPPTGPSQSETPYIERRSVLNPGSHHCTGSPALYQVSYGTGYAKLQIICFAKRYRS